MSKKVLIICVSDHHKNTLKIANVIGNVLDAKIIEPKEIDINAITNYDIIGFGSGIRNMKHHSSLLRLAENINDANGEDAFVFATAMIPAKTTRVALKEILVGKGFNIIGDFCCKGFMSQGFVKYIFGGVNKKRPNSKDLKKAKEFAVKIRDY